MMSHKIGIATSKSQSLHTYFSFQKFSTIWKSDTKYCNRSYVDISSSVNYSQVCQDVAYAKPCILSK